MKKILFVISQLYKGGAEHALVNLLNIIDYSKYEVDLLILNQQVDDNTISLVSYINSNVKVCDAYAEYKNITLFDRIRAKTEYSMAQKSAYYFTALDFVKGKFYNWAFFWGEWCSPSFVAYYVTAEKKAAWIHSDIATASFFNSEEYFYFYDYFQYFIFVSRKSMESAVLRFPFLKGKTKVIYNISNVQHIKEQQQETVNDYKKPIDKKVIITCANIREEKNHLRQIEVMIELRRRGIAFQWINIGSLVEKERVEYLRQKCKDEHLEEDFLFLGAKENPYKYMKQADLVAVLSDHESWSMVITEAKILGIPVIATKTSGALEQLEDNVTGILTEFDIDDIADHIEQYLTDENRLSQIRNNLKDFDDTQKIITEFYDLLENSQNETNRTSLVYIIDDVNYLGGAHNATFAQIRKLQESGNLDITIFSTTTPNCDVRIKVPGVKFASWHEIRSYEVFSSSFLYCMGSRNFTMGEKKYRLKLTYAFRMKKEKDILGMYIVPDTSNFFSKYDIVCVMSEGSIFRKASANSKCKKKIQWIHTDYCAWREKTSWTQEITKDDGDIYNKIDVIVTLSDGIRKKMSALYPQLADKIVVNKNVIPVGDILKKAETKIKNKEKVRFITVGRIDNNAKACYRLIEVLLELAEEGYRFQWTFIGIGEDYEGIKHQIETTILKEYVIMKGAMKNPFPEMKKADVFALLSTYEGVPNTIYEALILGLPVLATNVGGIADQVIEGQNGWLVSNNKEEIKKAIIHILMHPEEVKSRKENVSHYQYNNEEIITKNDAIFSLGE